MDNYKAEIGKRISYLRSVNGLTQEKLAELLDCSVKHVSHAERGAALFSLEKYLFLSDYFHCSLDYLLKGTGSDDVSLLLPSCILEILRAHDTEEQRLLLTYLNMYSQLRSHRDDND
ncbi:MAG: helix-turn-helix transcriptional regulator [Lachnospiraceae bacterium]|nr:helix-turn-helix transcriptional regulator [Lachnospiraceae bacterium]